MSSQQNHDQRYPPPVPANQNYPRVSSDALDNTAFTQKTSRYISKPLARSSNSSEIINHISDNLHQLQAQQVQPSSPLPNLFNRWLQFTLPPTPDSNSSLKAQERYRRSRNVSIMMLVLVIGLIASLIPALISHATFGTIILSVILFFVLIVIGLNKIGQITLAGFLFVGIFCVGFAVSYSFLRSGLTISQVIGYDMLIVSVLLAPMFFPAWSVFVVALFNIVFIYINFNFAHYDTSLQQLVNSRGSSIGIERTLLLQVMTAILTYIMVESMQRALSRANRAEELARLQQTIVEQQQEAADQKVQLEASINHIVDTLTHYANGHLQARVPLTQDNVLWHIAGSINNLLGRVQRLKQENDALREALARVSPGSTQNQQPPQSSSHGYFNRPGYQNYEKRQ